MSPEQILSRLQKLSEQEILRTLVKQYVAPDFDEAFEKADRILCISPHPDDCEVGAGGIIAKYADMGKEVTYIVMTDGSMGTHDPNLSPEELVVIRKKEQEEAAKILGVRKIYWLNYRDGELSFNTGTRNRLITLIRAIKPDIVLAPDAWLPYESHPDHVNTGKLAAAAVIMASLPHFNPEDRERGLQPWRTKYMAFYYTSRPNKFIDITNHFSKKLEAIKRHESQFAHSWQLMQNLITLIAMLYGRKIGVKYADAVKLLPTFLLHAIPVAEYI